MTEFADATWAALCILDHAAGQARRGPVAASDAVMDAVVVLSDAGVPEDALHEFLRTLAEPGNHAWHESSANYQRGTMATTLLHGISRKVGVERCARGMEARMRDGWPAAQCRGR